MEKIINLTLILKVNSILRNEDRKWQFTCERVIVQQVAKTALRDEFRTIGNHIYLYPNYMIL